MPVTGWDAGDWRQQKERNQKHRWNQYEQNMEYLRGVKAVFHETNACACLFREDGKPTVDFYPTTNKWKHIFETGTSYHNGGARKFWKWYSSQSDAG